MDLLAGARALVCQKTLEGAASQKPDAAHNYSASRPPVHVCQQTSGASLIASQSVFLVLDAGPPPAFGAAQDGVNDAHIGDGIFNRRGHVRVVEDRLSEGIALEGVLVADLKRDLIDLAVVFVPDFAGPVGRSIEGDFNLDAPGCAKDIHALVR